MFFYHLLIVDVVYIMLSWSYANWINDFGYVSIFVVTYIYMNFDELCKVHQIWIKDEIFEYDWPMFFYIP